MFFIMKMYAKNTPPYFETQYFAGGPCSDCLKYIRYDCHVLLFVHRRIADFIKLIITLSHPSSECSLAPRNRSLNRRRYYAQSYRLQTYSRVVLAGIYSRRFRGKHGQN